MRRTVTPRGECTLQAAPRARVSSSAGMRGGGPLDDAATARERQVLYEAALVPYILHVTKEARMAAKAERLEARLTSAEREQIEQAAVPAGESVSSFVVLAALGRADILVREQASTVVPAANATNV